MITQAVADIDPNRPLKELHLMGVPDSEIVITTNRSQAEDALAKGKYLVTEDAVMLSTLEGLDILVEATGYTEIGAQGDPWILFGDDRAVLGVGGVQQSFGGLNVGSLPRQFRGHAKRQFGR